jgi:hypothetical protein
VNFESRDGIVTVKVLGIQRSCVLHAVLRSIFEPQSTSGGPCGPTTSLPDALLTNSWQTPGQLLALLETRSRISKAEYLTWQPSSESSCELESTTAMAQLNHNYPSLAISATSRGYYLCMYILEASILVSYLDVIIIISILRSERTTLHTGHAHCVP